MTLAITPTHEGHAVQSGVVLIPLNKLKKTPEDVQKTPKVEAGTEALAASLPSTSVRSNESERGDMPL